MVVQSIVKYTYKAHQEFKNMFIYNILGSVVSRSTQQNGSVQLA